MLVNRPVCLVPLALVATSAFAQATVQDAQIVSLGGGTSGATGEPRFELFGSPVPGRPFALRLVDGAPFAPAMVAASVPAMPLPLPDLGATVHVLPPFAASSIVLLDESGRANSAFLPQAIVSPSFVGIEFAVQGAVLDPTALGAIAFSDAHFLRVGSTADLPALGGTCHEFGAVRSKLVGADLDGDGDDDVVVEIGPLFWGGAGALLSRGDGRFDAHPGVVDLAGARSTQVADLDGDGLPDLVQSTTFPIGVVVRRGLGDGTFAPFVLLPTSAVTYGVAVDDFDGDGVLDVAASIPSGVVFMRGLGGAVFAAALPSASAPDIRALFAGRVDADLHLDLVAVTTNGTFVQIGDGQGAFGAPVAVATDAWTGSLAADFDGDGWLDVATMRKSAHVLDLHLCNGDGSFQPPVSMSVGPTAYPPTSADVDGDGNLDLLLPASDDPRIEVLRGDGAGAFTLASVVTTSQQPESVGCGDFDADGRLDLAILSNNRTATIVFGNGDGTFATPLRSISAPVRSGVELADLDHDGELDLVALSKQFVTQSGAHTHMHVQLGAGGGVFGVPAFQVAAPAGPPFDSVDLELVDLDSDGDHDVVTSGGNSFGVALGRGDGTFDTWSARAGAGAYAEIFVADVDGDAVPDVIATPSSLGGPALLRGLGNGQFAAPLALPLAGSWRRVVAADFDGDGHQDLAAITSNPSRLAILPGLGGATFGAPTEHALSGLTFMVETLDVDNDGHLDIVVPCSFPPALDVFLGRGDGTFDVLASQPLPYGPSRSHFADMDGDGIRDFVTIVAPWSSHIGMARGRGDGTFEALELFFTGGGGMGIAIGDLDGDLIPDVVTGSSRSLVSVSFGRLLR